MDIRNKEIQEFHSPTDFTTIVKKKIKSVAMTQLKAEQ
jgi:hypothetical protein